MGDTRRIACVRIRVDKPTDHRLHNTCLLMGWWGIAKRIEYSLNVANLSKEINGNRSNGWLTNEVPVTVSGAASAE